MSEKKLKHLDFIQNTISRMSTNSFIIKGWAITLVSALFVLSQKDTNANYVVLTYLAIPVFWYLNGYFLLQERRYRELYNFVRQKDESNIDFSMDASGYNSGKNTILSCLISTSIWPIYLFILIISLGIICFK